MQLWRFVIVNNRQWVKKCSDASKKAILEGIEKDPNSPMKGYANTLKNDNFNVFHNAPAVVYIVGTAKAATLTADCSLLTAYFMLAAAARGLGTCWIAQGAEIVEPELREALGIPENYKIVAPIALGYPKAIPPMPARKEPKILKIIS
jgi:nitroreductase